MGGDVHAVRREVVGRRERLEEVRAGREVAEDEGVVGVEEGAMGGVGGCEG